MQDEKVEATTHSLPSDLHHLFDVHADGLYRPFDVGLPYYDKIEFDNQGWLVPPPAHQRLSDALDFWLSVRTSSSPEIVMVNLPSTLRLMHIVISNKTSAIRRVSKFSAVVDGLSETGIHCYTVCAVMGGEWKMDF
ncbi:hypothetical protein PENPOL_c001G05291 [Penicillium polonicum]|uniref:Uncharacterized protein n=1 Tax=Penicillium polonicum TaxID=60169 RepID=A0A1V6P567_PENPO|nr:hypothetical protein PENPOL_c001G05291 [Penicillium polonicum]